MSGIAAVVRFDGGEVEPGVIEAMTAAMSYRGPDGIHHWRHGPVALGHCMMRTTAESLEETQPLSNEDDSITLVFDGYLSNWEELRTALLERGARLRTRSDAELILRAYECWGEECPKHIDGEYAFLVWDERRREVYCARDHVGLRPLLYHWDGKVLVVASDVAGILAAPGVSRTLNKTVMAEFMADVWLTRDETVWANVMRLLPAHSMRAASAGPKASRYWSLPLEHTIRHGSDEDYIAHYRTMFSGCVRRASRTHLPLAFEVSGGLDSSGICSMARHLQSAGKLPAPKIKGYTLAGDPGSASDEVQYARAVGHHLQIPIREVPLFCPDFGWFSDTAARNLDMPPYPNLADMVGLGQAVVADGSRVAINGAGGDQWLDGTPHYYHELLRQRHWSELLDSFRLDTAAYGFRKTIARSLRFGIYPFAPNSIRSIIRELRENHNNNRINSHFWMADEFRDILHTALFKKAIKARLEPYNSYKMGKLEFPYLLHNFDQFSRQCARIGYEPRSPMLSRAFVEFSAATPERMRLRGGITKFIHRRALSGILPEAVANRSSKAEFSTVFDRHLRDLGAFCLDSRFAAQPGPIDPAGFRRLWANHCAPDIDEHRIWELWGTYGVNVLTRLAMTEA